MFLIRNISISRKLVLVILLTTGAALLLACAGFVTRDLLTFRSQMKQDLSSRAELVGNSSTAALIFNDPEPLAEIMKALAADPHLASAHVFNKNGEVLSAYVRADLTGRVRPPSPAAEPGARIDSDYLWVFQPVKTKDGMIGTVVLQSDLRAIRSRTRHFATIAGIVLVISFGAAILLSARLQRLISKPILDLANTANAVAEKKDYSIRAVKRSEDEIGHLVDRFNEMLAQIQARDAALQSSQDRLEQRVIERTSELSQANATLQQEIQERKRVEEGLRQSEERFGLAFHASPLAICICTLDGGELLNVNESFLKLFHCQREQVLGKSVAELKLWRDPEEHRKLFAAVQNGEPVHDRECQMGSDYAPIQTLVSIAGMNVGGTRCALVLITDVTARIALENQLRHAQKMEAIGQLAAGVAHDYNNLMTIVQGYTEMAMSMHPNDAVLMEALRQVAEAVERATDLTRQLLAFSRRQVMQLRVLEVNDVVSNLVKMLSRLLGEDITLELHLSPRLPRITADVGMLEQVITNLAVNARDAMPQGGYLTVATEAALFENSARLASPRRPGRFVCLRISDTGCGMDSATLSRIFEPFFTTKEVGKGTGLGLATVYGIVQQHQGWIEVNSETGAGTEFKVYLPASSEATAATPEANVSAPPRGGNETILVVEDEPSLRRLVRSILEQNGYTVLVAADGIEAAKIWSQHSTRIDLLLTDLVMPGGVSGRELADTLKAKRPDLKVIYTSGYATDSSNLQKQEGFNFLAKPYAPAHLLHTVRARLECAS